MSRVLYGADKDTFFSDVMAQRFIPLMMDAAAHYRIGYSDSELKSWRMNSFQIVCLLTQANAPADTYVSFEYRVPHGGSRIDCMLYGKGRNDSNNVIHIELKQWENKTVSELYSTGVFKVEALTGKHFQPVPHPSQQVANYQQYLSDYVEVFQKNCNLVGLAYCYNYNSKASPNDLYSNHYKAVLNEFPLYSGDQINELASRLNELICLGQGLQIFNNVQDSPIRHSKNLMDAAANMFRGVTEFSLLQDQLAASETIFGEVENTIGNNNKTVIIVKGGPGTGKTVIALHILAQLAQNGQHTNCFFTTRSKALRNNLKLKLKDIQVKNNLAGNAGNLIRNIYEFKPYHYRENELDVLLIDEAHRISKSSNHMSDKKYETTYLSQVMSLIYCSKVCVFFIDDNQAITNTEIGTSSMIRDAAEHYAERLVSEKEAFLNKLEKVKKSLFNLQAKKATLLSQQNAMSSNLFIHALTEIEKKIHLKEDEIAKEKATQDVVSAFTGRIRVVDFELKSQFRCNGSDNYLDWLDETLYKSYDKIQFGFDKKEYDFRIFDSPHDLYAAIKALDKPFDQKKQTARLAAGYCWDWKGELTPQGDLKKEVVIGDFQMPWETLTPARSPYREKYASSADTWAIEPEGINQVGCVFSIQGLEIDYIGVIIGPDLSYDLQNDCLKAVPGVTHNMNPGDDPDRFVKNIYRVLMSRGKKGCYVYCCDSKVAEYLSRCAGK